MPDDTDPVAEAAAALGTVNAVRDALNCIEQRSPAEVTKEEIRASGAALDSALPSLWKLALRDAARYRPAVASNRVRVVEQLVAAAQAFIDQPAPSQADSVGRARWVTALKKVLAAVASALFGLILGVVFDTLGAHDVVAHLTLCGVTLTSQTVNLLKDHWVPVASAATAAAGAVLEVRVRTSDARDRLGSVRRGLATRQEERALNTAGVAARSFNSKVAQEVLEELVPMIPNELHMVQVLIARCVRTPESRTELAAGATKAATENPVIRATDLNKRPGRADSGLGLTDM